ncbi:mixed lineage kinase domain-like protein isoform X2 [Bufo gargarizans]|uniref:mixed lineage kinase domain-like protein isoform X2 n=1 Tax=Bufo gargarizans TaxID=30331 RepID=UPI001CF2E4E5|nr:mixed lineage kinase domain-like protein isoform X2 [Bufo gargarizans]XP_044125888.1 mixed lineage kinase domain-like protein isoform X2 [Bufo gargarizans]
MDVLGQVLDVAQTIYGLCDQASSNKQQCHRLKKRIQILLMASRALQSQKEKSAQLKVVMNELRVTLDNAKCWAVKYSHQAWWRQILQANSIKEEFELINDRLGDAAGQVSLLLEIEHREKFFHFFTENTRKRQNQRDIDEDLQELKNYLTQNISNKMENMEDGMKKILSEMAAIQAVCKRSSWHITEIRATDLKRGPLLLEKPSHDLYLGEYHRGPVAIKVFKGQQVKDQDFIIKTFQAEGETMKKFECLNILRLYGICVDNSGTGPCYSLVMEYCQKGTLRQLLEREPDLPPERRVQMALDASRAVYRLHQTEMKAILHGSLSSAKFLVDGTYCVKLSGFEFSKTESSMRRNPVKSRSEISELVYIAPETWQDINAYDKRSEIYSLGVVIFEIAVGGFPLQHESTVLQNTGSSAENLEVIHQKLCAAVDVDLPTSCPPVIRDIIKKSQAKDPRSRPSAGAIADLLLAY